MCRTTQQSRRSVTGMPVALFSFAAFAALAGSGPQDERSDAQREAIAKRWKGPVVTEVFFAVTPGQAGDANGDGSRHSTGDEFVELCNVSDKPIDLRGYTLTDRNPAESGQFRFEFPRFTLPPGGVVLVFNGFEQKWKGPVGTAEKAPSGANERFNDAWVFNAAAPGRYTALANSGDHVVLYSPEGDALQVVWWGKYEQERPNAPLVDEAPGSPSGSVACEKPFASFKEHPDRAGKKLSPGWVPWSKGRG